MPDQTPRDSAAMNEGEILLYRTPDGAVRVEVFFRDETFWLTQARMAELFGATRQASGYHLRNIFESKELDREATSKEILLVRNEGGREVSRNEWVEKLDAFLAIQRVPNSARCRPREARSSQASNDKFWRIGDRACVSDFEKAVKEIAALDAKPHKRKAGK